MPLAIGGVADHVHLLVRFTATVTIAQLVGEAKGASSHAMNHAICCAIPFRWQGGYGAFTLSSRSQSNVRAYVLNQRSHHTMNTLVATLEQTHEDDSPTPSPRRRAS
ncbi:MAG: transposase [Roseiflexaceae bacterium]|nr:transposase [Roseiflexaceae bacterium]